MSINSSGAITTRVDGNTTYGIEIRDLQRAFGITYCDLVLLHIADKPSAAASDADDAEVVRDANNNVVFRSAFYLGRSQASEGVIPLPSGWTIDDRPNTDKGPYGGGPAYVKGDLLYGRRPYWNIFSAYNNIGKNIYQYSPSQVYFNINIFRCPFNANNTNYPTGAIRLAPNLEQWQDYDGAGSGPVTNFEDRTLTMEYHNGVLQKCNDDTTYYSVSNPDTASNSRKVYVEESETDNLDVLMSLGYLPDWWKATAPYSTLMIYGMAAQVKHTYVKNATTNTLTLAFVMRYETTPLCGASSQGVQTLYRTGVDAQTGKQVFNMPVVAGVGNLTYDELLDATNHTLDATGEVVLLLSNSYGAAIKKIESLGDGTYAYLSAVIPDAEVRVVGSIDPSTATNESSNFRMVLCNQTLTSGGTTYTIAPAYTSSTPFTSPSSTDQSYAAGLSLPLYLYSGTKQSPTIVALTGGIQAYFEVTSTDASTKVINDFQRHSKVILPYNTMLSDTPNRMPWVAVNKYYGGLDGNVGNTGQTAASILGQSVDAMYGYGYPVCLTSNELYGSSTTEVPTNTTVKVWIYPNDGTQPATLGIYPGVSHTYDETGDGWLFTSSLYSKKLYVSRGNSAWLIPLTYNGVNAWLTFNVYNTALTQQTTFALGSSEPLYVRLYTPTSTEGQYTNIATFTVRAVDTEYISNSHACTLTRPTLSFLHPADIDGTGSIYAQETEVYQLRFALHNTSAGQQYFVSIKTS